MLSALRKAISVHNGNNKFNYIQSTLHLILATQDLYWRDKNLLDPSEQGHLVLGAGSRTLER